MHLFVYRIVLHQVRWSGKGKGYEIVDTEDEGKVSQAGRGSRTRWWVGISQMPGMMMVSGILCCMVVMYVCIGVRCRGTRTMNDRRSVRCMLTDVEWMRVVILERSDEDGRDCDEDGTSAMMRDRRHGDGGYWTERYRREYGMESRKERVMDMTQPG